MTPTLSPNTKAILLLTAPLLAGRGGSTPDLLTPSEYKRLARHLREIHHQPADLASPEADELLHACQHVIDEDRLRRLLGRGFLLGQVIEHWQARAIWVVSRADPDYPRRLKARLREDAPAVLYGCGDVRLLEGGGLAVVGSRHVNDALVDYTLSVGGLAAHANRNLISGGARGIDQAAMRGALEAGGKVCGVLADSLEKTTMNREHRNQLLGGQLTLISPYDPIAGFNVGNAMQRNKLIYGLADAALVVSSDVDKGGTWSGAVEQLDKLRFVPIFVRSTGEPSAGLNALTKKGALVWPNPSDGDSLEAILRVPPSASDMPHQARFTLGAGDVPADSAPSMPTPAESAAVCLSESEPDRQTKSVTADRPEQTKEPPHEHLSAAAPADPATPDGETPPAEALFAAVRHVMRQLLVQPMKDADVAATLEVSAPQAKAWLQRLADEGILEKRKHPLGYVVKQTRLFE
jgi:predicted Rossmann fold nucleotide-binding protein DprA/Smf involved in DNA uptake